MNATEQHASPTESTSPQSEQTAETNFQHLKLLAECKKLEAETAHQMRINKYWWTNWIIAGVVAGISLATIGFSFVKDYFTILQSTNTIQKAENERLAKTNLAGATEIEKLHKEAEELRQNQKLAEERADQSRKESDSALVLSKAALEQNMQRLSEQERLGRETLEKLQREIANTGRNGNEVQARLAEVTAQLQQERDAASRLKLDLVNTKERLETQQFSLCRTTVAAITGMPPDPGETGARLIARVLAQYAPFNDLSAATSTTNERAAGLGLPPGSAIGSIGLSNRLPIVFTDTEILFSNGNSTASITYRQLPDLQLSQDNNRLHVGPKYIFDFSRSNFSSAHARLLLLQLAQVVRSCGNQFEKSQS